MKEVKLYNMIFPIWLLIFIPPIIIGVMALNFIIDSIVILICFYIFKNNIKTSIWILYKKSILKVWLIGFLADFVGAGLLLIISLLADSFEVTSQIAAALMLNPFRNRLAVFIVFICILISAYFIYRWNYKRVFNKSIEDVALRLKIALIVAIVTAPWTFLIPTNWLYPF